MGMLAFFAGGCIPQAATRLGFIFNANKQRSGKSLLAKFMVSPIFGSFKGGPWREKEEEMQKLLDSEILAASPYISFDNVRGLIASQPLETFMTSPSWSGRILGKTESFFVGHESPPKVLYASPLQSKSAGHGSEAGTVTHALSIQHCVDQDVR